MKRHANTQAMIDKLEEMGEAQILDKRTNSIARANEHGLTEKQELFAQGVANGLTLKEAYVRSYDAKEMAVSSVYSESSRLMDKPEIAARVKSLMALREERTFANDAKRIRQHVFDRLMIESVDDESNASARIKALELLGKIDIVSMFKEQKGPTEVEQMDVAGLEAKLKAVLAKVIDITPAISGTIKATEDDDDERK